MNNMKNMRRLLSTVVICMMSLAVWGQEVNEQCELTLEIGSNQLPDNGEWATWLELYAGDDEYPFFVFEQLNFGWWGASETIHIPVTAGVPLRIVWSEPDQGSFSSWFSLYDPLSQRMIASKYSGEFLADGEIAIYTPDCGASCTDKCPLQITLTRTPYSTNYAYSAEIWVDGMSFVSLELEPSESRLDTTLLFCPGRSVDIWTSNGGEDFAGSVTDPFGNEIESSSWGVNYSTRDVCAQQCELTLEIGAYAQLENIANPDWIEIYAGDDEYPFYTFYRSDWYWYGETSTIPVSAGVPLRIVWHDPDPENHQSWFALYDPSSQRMIAYKYSDDVLPDGEIATYTPDCGASCTDNDKCPLQVALTRTLNSSAYSYISDIYVDGMYYGGLSLEPAQERLDTTLLFCPGRSVDIYSYNSGSDFAGTITDPYGNVTESSSWGVNYSTRDVCAQQCNLAMNIGSENYLETVNHPWIAIYAGDDEYPFYEFNRSWTSGGQMVSLSVPADMPLRFVWHEPDSSNFSSWCTIYDYSGNVVFEKQSYTEIPNGNILNNYTVACGSDSINNIVYVKHDGTGSGSSWADALSSIEAASVIAFTHGADVWVAAGTYYGDTSEYSQNAFTMLDGVDVYGGFAGNEPADYDLSQRDFETNATILDGQNARRVLYQNSSFNTLTTWDGFVIQNGRTPDYYDYGAGAYLYSNGKINHCIVRNNTAYSGGGVYAGYYSAVTNCLIANNTASYSGGGIYSYYANITNTTIVRNSGNNGAGVHGDYSGNLTNSIVWGNGTNEMNNIAGTVTCSYSAIEGGYAGENNILLSDPLSQDPLFVNPTSVSGVGDNIANADWHLQQGSPCINRGNNAAVSGSSDLAGTARIKRDTVDMGCYESDYYSSPITLPDYTNIVYVTPSGAGMRTGESWENATSSLAFALSVARTYHADVWVAAGTYYGDTTAISENAFIMADGVNTYGGFVGNEPVDYDLSQRDFETNTTILDGMNARRVLYQSSSFNTLTTWDGFTIQNGRAHNSGNGGGVYLRSKGELSHCIIRNNTGYYGGGVYASYGTVANCRVSNNTANYGGGMYAGYNSTLSNCLVSNNTASYTGGGVYNYYATITNSTIVRNAANNGAGIYGSSSGNLINSIVWGNGTNVMNNISGTLSCSYSAIEGGYSGEHNILLSEQINQESMFVSPSQTSGVSESASNADWHLLDGSPCINRGNNAAVADSWDLAGTARIQRDTVDMGCYESEYYSSPITLPDYSNIIYVTQEGAGSQTGESWENATSSLSFALSVARTYHADVWVAAGIYYGDTTETSENAFTMVEGVNVYGGFAGNEPADYNLSQRNFETNTTILDGMNARRVLYQPSNFNDTTTWDGFSILNGYYYTEDYYSCYGGGAYLYNGILKNCIIRNNRADRYGGGVYVCANGKIISCAISHNYSSYGGGIYVGYSNPYPTVNVVNCLISNNDGGGVCSHYNLFVKNSTIVCNNSSGLWDSNYDYGVNFNPSGSSSCELINCIVWGNSGHFGLKNLSSAISCSYSAIEGGYEGEGNVSLNDCTASTLFVNPALSVGVSDNTENVDWHLQDGSVCVNRGSNAAVFDTLDLDGTARIKHGTVDMGCYESDYLINSIPPIPLPVVQTNSVTGITATSAVCGGDVASDCNDIVAYGVCWNTSLNPTLSNSYTVDGAGNGSFSSVLSGLTPNTTYYVRSYATNSAGTVYGEEVSFSTECNSMNVSISGPTDVTDATIVLTAGDVWGDGTGYQILIDADNIGWTETHGPDCGSEYTIWEYMIPANASADDAAVVFNATQSINIPAGIYSYLILNPGCNDYGTNYIAYNQCDATNATDFFFEAGKTYTFTPELSAGSDCTILTITGSTSTAATESNTISINYGQDTTLIAHGAYTYLWSTGESGESINVSPTTTTTYSVTGTNLYGCSATADIIVNVITLPIVTTDSITAVTSTSATCGGNVTNDGGAEVTARGVCWSTQQNPTLDDAHTADGSGTGAFTSSITDLAPNTTYYVRAYATNSEGTEYGNEKVFITLQDYDSIIYVTVTGAGDRSGNSWANATSSIEDAQALAQTYGAVVWVAAGTYYGDTTSTSENAFTMRDGVNVYGGFVGNEPADYDLSSRNFETNATILDGQNARRVLYQPFDFNNQTEWNGFTIQHGYINGNGGGVYMRGNFILTYCVVQNSKADIPTTNENIYGGGGVFANVSYATSPKAKIVHCTLRNNIAIGERNSQGGGISAIHTDIEHSQLLYNQAIVRCNNSNCYGEGGGLYLSSSYVSSCVVSNCLIANNTATSGGGIECNQGTIINTTIVRNACNSVNAGAVGAGISGYFSLFNSIVWGNVKKNVNSSDNVDEFYSHVIENSAIECSSVATVGSRIGANCIILNASCFVNPSIIAGASDTTSNVDWHLQNESICVNRGNNSAVTDSLDLDGMARIKRDTVDMGCYESDYNSVPSVEYGGIVYVTPTGAGTQSGESWTNAISSIKEAQVLARTLNAVVWVAAGTYYGDTTATARNAFTMREGVNVYGGFAGNEPANYDLSQRDFVTNETVLDGDSSRRVLYQSNEFNTETVWDGFTIQNGQITGNGGNSYFQDGGGAYLRNNSTIRSCIFRNNNAIGDGGGLFLKGGERYGYNLDYIRIEYCSIISNSSFNSGGGLYAYTSNWYNGGVSAVEVVNCLVSNNTAGAEGGGIYGTGGRSNIRSTTIARNRSGSSGSGASGSTLTNCLVWGNERNGTPNNLSGCSSTYSAIEDGYEGEGNIALDDICNRPMFVYPSLTAGASDTTANADWHLQQGSACINRGNNTVVTDSIDLDGTARIKRDTVDMGCYESDYYGNSTNILPVVTTYPISDTTANSALCGGTAMGCGDSIIAYGVCWNTEPNPTLENNYTVDGAGIGSFTSTLSELTESTTYYVRAYATNSYGTSYGNEVVFTTLQGYQGIIYVTQTGAGNRSGNSWENATSSIDTAQALAQTYDAVIWVAAGTYYGDTTSTSENAFTMRDGVNVYGGFVGNEPADYDLSQRDFEANTTILDGMNARRVLNQPSNFNAETKWDGFTIQKGQTSGNGAGVYMRNHGHLSHCKVQSNVSTNGNGGGVYCSNAVVEECDIVENTCRNSGGGIYIQSSSIVSDCRIVDNTTTSSQGGGVYSSSSTVTECLIKGNTSYSYGGGVHIVSSTIRDCNILENTSNNRGGGVNASSGNIISCQVSHNQSSNAGGGLYISSSTQVRNCLVDNNSAGLSSSYGGGGIYGGGTVVNTTIVRNSSSGNGAGISGSASTNLKNCIVWGNKRNGEKNNISGNNIVCVNSAIEDGYSGTDLVLFDNSINNPLFVNPSLSAGASDSTANVDWHLQNGSVCVNRGDNSAITDTIDLDGNARIQRDTIDLGCYESDYYSVPMTMYDSIIYVTQAGAGNRSGNSWENAIPSIEEAQVLAQVYNAVVWVATGTYYGDTTAANAFTMIEGVNVYGGFAGNEPADYDLSQRDFEDNTTILDGMNARRVLNQPSSFSTQTTWNGFALQNGQTSGNGGGAYIQNKGVLSQCEIMGCNANGGGGVYVSAGTISECLITGCTAGNGGGVNCTNKAVISSCRIAGNNATGAGGGVYTYNSTIVDCDIIDNETSGSGGGVYCYYSTHVLNTQVSPSDILRCIISGNHSSNSGGGVCFGFANDKLNNCLVSNNSSNTTGGGVFGKGRINNTTIVRNYSTGEGGGLNAGSYNSYYSGNIMALNNCVVWGNVSNGGSNNIKGSSNTCTCSYSAIEEGYSGTGNILLDETNQPHFVNPAHTAGFDDSTDNVDWHLQQASVCINRGDNSAVTDTLDLDGNARIQRDTVDMGCYESDYYSVPMTEYDSIIYVTVTGAGTRSGDSWANATSSIEEAQTLAQTYGAVVWVAAGTYYGDTDSTSNNAFTMVDGVNVYGGFAGNEPADYDLSLRDFEANATILDGQNARRVLNQPSSFNAQTTWNGFVMQNGQTSGNGGGAYLQNNGVLSQCKIIACMAPNGGGVYNSRGTISECIISSCSANEGGGVNCTDNATISSCILSNNNAINGGGVFSYNSSIVDCDITMNAATGSGGGVYCYYRAGLYFYVDPTNVTRCRIVGNQASNGGGICLGYGNDKVRNCLISNNTANMAGGGIIGKGHVYNTTIVRNTSTDDGAGVNGSTSTTLTNCIVWGNEWNGDVNNLNGSSIVCSYSAIEGGYIGDSIIVLNDINRPLFVNPSLTAGANDNSVDVDWHLQQGSVCVNRGDNSVVTDTLDLDGTARIKRDTVDMGCYESDYYSIPVTGYNSIIYVTVTGAGTQSGDSWANATSSIDEAQTLAQTYDAVVWVAAGTYYGDTTSNAFTMRDGVSVYGGFVGNEPANYDLSQRDFETNTTILDGQNARRVLYQPYEFNNRAEWNGFTIRNGQTSGSGAGAYLQRNAMLSQCRVEGNTSTNGSGGGVYCNNATVDHCEIVNNSCRNSGGGVYASSSELSDCRIESNTATTSSGGGVYAISSTIANCYITDNQSVGNGGGAWSYNTQFTYCNIFGNNTTGSGGGVYSHYSTHIIYPQVDPTIISCCQIHGNQSGNSGGGIRMGYNNDKVLNSLVCNNTSGNAGGGINGNGKLVNTTVVCNLSNGNGGGLAGDIDLKNCIVWGNKRYGVIDNVSGNSVSCSYSAIEGGFIGEGNFILGEANSGAENSPCFANPTTGPGAVNDNGDWHLLPQSICINGGDPNTSILSETDLDGLPRLQQSRVDMGCYEYQNVTMPIEDTVIITVVSDNIMRGVATGSGIYNAGDTVVLRAVPSLYARFLRWNDNDTNNPRMVIADTNTTFTATFDLDLPELHVTSITHSDMIGGESATVSWTVRNDGNVSTPDGVVWYDRVWLSLDPKVDVNIGSPILLGAFPNVSALAPDEYYTQTRTVDIPLQVSGDYYLFVIADCYDADQIFWENGVEEPYNPPTFYGALSHDCGGADCENIAGNKILEISEYDNYSRYPYYHDNFFYETVEVATPAYPDLVVTHVVPSSYPFLSISELTQYVLIHSQMTQITLNFYSGSEVTLSYRVLNDGNYDTRVSDWRDVIFISNHSEFDETAQALNVVSHSGLLLPDSAYLMSTTVRIPLEIYDTAYFYVYTDFYDQVYEHIGRYNNVTRSGAFNVILTPPADLVPRNITADQTVSTGATFNFSYEIHNRGAGEPNHSSWRDRCYLSTNPNSITNAVQIADDWHSGGIAVGGFYAVQHSISLPSNLSQGTYYLFVKADALDNVFEYTMEDNNLARFVQPISVLQPDLQIPILNVADTLHAGAEASVSYQLANTGDGAVVNRNVTNGFYLSRYSNGASATQLPQFTSNIWLNAYDNTIKYQNVMLPSDLQDGIYYLFARTNVNNAVNEANTDNNMSPIKQVYINHQLLPDLVITSVTAPDTLTAGASATFTATIANHGERPAALSNLDFLLSAAAAPEDILCTTVNVSTESQSLAVEDSTTVTMTIRISPAVNNPASFTLTVNPDHTISESSYSNNGYAFDHSVQPYPFDLAVTDLSSSSQTISGEYIPVTWTVQNQGTVPILFLPMYMLINFHVVSIQTSNLSQPWYDRIYLSSDTLLDANDVQIGNYSRYQTLLAGDSYTANLSCRIPVSADGNYYVLVVSDATNVTFDSQRANNVAASPVAVTQSALPDLQMDTLEVSSTLTTGVSYQIRYAVSNEGEHITHDNRWTDAFYINNIPSLQDAQQLVSKIHNGQLDVSASYSDIVSVTIPNTWEGNCYLIGYTDATDQIFEMNSEDNNLFILPVSVVRPLPCDLTVLPPDFPQEAIVGENVQISWTLQNIGLNTAQGNIKDAVYLSTDSTWSSDDIMLGSVTHNVNLTANGQQQRNATFPLQGVPVGDYYVMVRTNILNALNENSYTNNKTVSLMTMHVDYPSLYIDQEEHRQLSSGQSVYYKLEVGPELANQTLSCKLSSASQNVANGLYIAYSSAPSTSNFDWSATMPYMQEQEILIPSLNQGTYYIMANGHTSNNSSQSVTLLATIINFEIISVNANSGANTGSVTTQIIGAKFDTIMDFRLANSNGYLPAEKIFFHNSTETYATFNLRNQEAGVYDMVAELPGGIITVKGQAFVVERGLPAELLTHIIAPASVRNGTTFTVTIEYGNNGSTDLNISGFLLVSANGFPIAFTSDSLANNSTELTFETGEPNGNPDVIRPGHFASKTIFVKASREGIINLKLYPIRRQY